MSGEVVRQLQVLCQALLLGGAMGLTYDLLRIVRVRLRLPLVGGALDLLFWLGATGALFLWSQGAWNGRVRLYGGGVLSGGRGGVLRNGEPLGAPAGGPGGPPGGLDLENFDVSGRPGPVPPEKNQKTYQKYLSFRDEMV